MELSSFVIRRYLLRRRWIAAGVVVVEARVWDVVAEIFSSCLNGGGSEMREAMAGGQMMHLVCAGSSFELRKARLLFFCSSFRSAANEYLSPIGGSFFSSSYASFLSFCYVWIRASCSGIKIIVPGSAETTCVRNVY